MRQKRVREYKLLRDNHAAAHSSPDPPHASQSFCPSPLHSGQSSPILPSPLHSGQRMMSPDSRMVPSPTHFSQSRSTVPSPSQSVQSVLPLPPHSLHFIAISLSYASRLWLLRRRSFSIEPNQVAKAFPYANSFSGSRSFFIAKFSS